MKAKFSESIQGELAQIYKKDKKLSDRIEKQIKLFKENPTHPSLRIHKLSGKIENQWSISITMSIRMIYLRIDDNLVIFVKIGTHDKVYRK